MTRIKGTVLSLFDFSTLAVRPWAEAGYLCYCFDKLHESKRVSDNLYVIRADLDPGASGWSIVEGIMSRARGKRIMFSWPPCEDMTTSGNRHHSAKRAKDPDFQIRASDRAIWSSEFADDHDFAWMVENPVGALCRLWRKPDHIWHPFEFGGYLPKEEVHPNHPKYIAPRDAYTKKTGAWIGGGFIFPKKKPVVPEILERETKSGRIIRGSRQFMLLGGSSERTKKIRNLSPRGASLAFFEANR